MAGDFNSLLSLAGIGADPKGGHALLLREMAGDLRAQSQLGRRPTVFEAFSAVAGAGEPRQARALNRP